MYNKLEGRRYREYPYLLYLPVWYTTPVSITSATKFPSKQMTSNKRKLIEAASVEWDFGLHERFPAYFYFQMSKFVIINVYVCNAMGRSSLGHLHSTSIIFQL